MRSLVIIGAGGCGREVLQWAKDINNQSILDSGLAKWNIKGFIDDDLKALEEKKCDVPILAKIDEYDIASEDEFVCCIGNSETRGKVISKLEAKGAKFTNIIHPSAVIADSATIGDETIIYPFALISDNAVIGDGSIINMYSSVAHDSVLGKYCTISAHCDITGMCTLGNYVFMGTTSNIVPGSKIGNNAYICAGSTVMSNLRDGVKVMGCPARKVNF